MHQLLDRLSALTEALCQARCELRDIRRALDDVAAEIDRLQQRCEVDDAKLPAREERRRHGDIR